MKAASTAPWSTLRPNASTTSTPNTAAAIAARLIAPAPGGRLGHSLHAPLARDLLGVLARARTPRSARPLDRARPACRGACACAFASPGPSDGDVTGLPATAPSITRRRAAPPRSRGARARTRAAARRPGKPSSAARGARPTSSASATAACGAHARHDLGERRRAVVVDVRGHLRAAAVGKEQADAPALPAGRRPTRAATRRSPWPPPRRRSRDPG